MPLFRASQPALAGILLAGYALLAACGKGAGFATVEGKPLDALALDGRPPHALALLGPDEVRLRVGERLAVSVDASPATRASLRFALDDGTLTILRQDGANTTDRAIIDVTMPAPEALTLASNGAIRAEALAPNARLRLAGPGRIESLAMATRSLAVTITDSGLYSAAGTTGALDLRIAGSGTAAMEGLKADNATVTISGQGSASFASDGEVRAQITDAGSLRVRGKARCLSESADAGLISCAP